MGHFAIKEREREREREREEEIQTRTETMTKTETKAETEIAGRDSRKNERERKRERSRERERERERKRERERERERKREKEKEHTLHTPKCLKNTLSPINMTEYNFLIRAKWQIVPLCVDFTPSRKHSSSAYDCLEHRNKEDTPFKELFVKPIRVTN